jgi:ubiquinone biosynthesis monooxygenase Coq7
MTTRNYTPVDRLLMTADDAMRTLCGRPPGSGRPDPTEDIAEGEMTDPERAKAARLMRVNHVGEICAQALYLSQSLTARDRGIADRMRRAAEEENDHLLWCERRIAALGGRKSLLNPAWYAGAFAIGALAGLAGDRWNLAFVAETEHQVVDHLDGHLHRLPPADARSRAVVAQMKSDEGRHATMALHAGAGTLPGPVRQAMRLASRVMTRTAHWI